MRFAADRQSGSRVEGREQVAPGWEQEWGEAAAVERDELGFVHAGPSRLTGVGLGVTAVVGALLPAILPLSPGYSTGATTVQVVAAAVAATAAISIVPASLLAVGGPWCGQWSLGRVLLYGVALASVGAAAIHFAVAKDHFAQYALFGVFFAGSRLAQLVWGMWVVVRPFRALFALGAAGNALIAALWVVDRVWGLPIGPEHWKPEPVGFADAAASGLELFIAAGCLALLRRDPGRARSASLVGRRAALLLALPVLVLTTLALLSVLGVASSFLTPAA